jgi:hypothetical protein
VHPAIVAIAATPIMRPAKIMARERMSISLLRADAPNGSRGGGHRDLAQLGNLAALDALLNVTRDP